LQGSLKRGLEGVEGYPLIELFEARSVERSIGRILEIWRKIGEEARKNAHRCSSKNVGIRHLAEISRLYSRLILSVLVSV
jgi:hypothetical protein